MPKKPVCAPPAPPPKPEPGEPCPTCIPDKNYVEPTWNLTEEPYLNKKTCEYMVSISVNSRGDVHTTSTVKTAGLPFKKLLKTYIRPGLRKMLRHFDKMETDEIVCASYTTDLGGVDFSNTSGKDLLEGKLDVKSSKYAFDKKCREVIDFDYSEFIKIKSKSATLQATGNYKIYDVDKEIQLRYPQIRNPNAIELYARAIDYHFTGFGESVMQVLIAIPAFIFDQVPAAPELPLVDTNVERLHISPRRLHSDIVQLKEVLQSFAQYQAFFYRYQNGSLYFTEDDSVTEAPEPTEGFEEEEQESDERMGEKFYIKFYVKRLELFEGALDKLLKQNDFTYYTFLNIRTPSLPWKLKFVFDKSNPKKPFTLKRVGAKIEGCQYKKLKKGLSSFLKKDLIQDQTLMGLIANIKSIKDDMNARETMGWLDFCLKYIYPNLGINYGSKDKYKEKTAVNCLADKLGLDGIDDFVHNSVGKFTDYFAYVVNQNACRALTDNFDGFQVLEPDGTLYNSYVEEWKKNKLAKIGEPSIIEEMLKDIKESWDDINGGDYKLQKLLLNLNPCYFFQIGLKAIQCLMSGMSLKDAYRAIIKKALATMAGEGLEKVMEALPYDKQEKIRAMVAEKFGDMPAPWESGYTPGSFDKIIDKRTADGLAKKQKDANDMLDNQSSALTKMKEIQTRIDELSECIDNPTPCTKEGRARPKPELKGPSYPELTSEDTLKRGDKGADVTALQTALNTLGQSLTVDGDYGKKTKTGVKAFQRSTNISVDGLAGPQTKATANSGLASKSATTQGAEATGQGSTNTLYGDILKELEDGFGSVKSDVTTAEQGLKVAEETIEALKKDQRDIGEKQEENGQKLEQKINEKKAFMNKVMKEGSISDPWTRVNMKDFSDKISALQAEQSALEKEFAGLIPTIESMERVILAKAKTVREATERRIEAYSQIGDREKQVQDRIKEIQAEWTKKREDLQKEFDEQMKIWKGNDLGFGAESLSPYANWADLSYEEQQKYAVQEKDLHDKRFMAGVSADDPDFEQGTYGKALGDISTAIAQTYIEAILETAELQELMSVLDRLPGIKLIGKFIASIKCPVTNFIYPPLSSFLGTLTFDPCGPGKTRMSFGKLPSLKGFNGWNFLFLVKYAFTEALKAIATEILMAIIFKLASIAFDLACQTLAAAGRAAFNAVTGNGGWRNAVDDIFCGKDKPEEERDDHAALVLKTAAPQIPGDAKDLVKTMSVIGTKDEYIRAISSNPEDQDMGFMKNLSSLIAAKHPEYIDTLGSPRQMVQFFSQVGNLLTAEQIGKLRELLDEESDVPLDESICLTDDQLLQWKTDRENALMNAGLDPSIAKDFVDRQDSKRRSDLADVAEILSKGHDGILQDALNEALGATDTDPGCDVSKSVVQIEKIDQVKNVMNKATKGMFKRLEKAFFDDIILWRWPMDPRSWWDTPGILSTILADTYGYTLNFHFIARQNIFFRFSNWSTFGLYPRYDEFPKTVGIKFREALLDTSFKIDGAKTKIPIKYDITKDYSWKSVITITDEYTKENDSGQEMYPPTFDYKFKQKSPENILKTFRVEKPLPPGDKLVKKYKLIPPASKLRENSFKTLVVKNMLNNWIYKDFQGVDISVNDTKSLIEKMQNIVSEKFINSLLDIDGEIPIGFLHGSTNQEIKAEDLEYVAPNGGDYDFDEEDAVFGKPRSKNPRVKFLDPGEYGGEYTSPNVYISPPKDEGLMEISKVFVPHLDSGCKTSLSESNFLRLKHIQETIDEVRSSLKPHKKLEFAPDCVKEIPYDKIASPATLASLEGCVIATIRVYLANLYTKTMPIWGTVALGSLGGDYKNHDALLPEYVVKLMERGLSNERSIWTRATYEGYPYWLMFLEQVAQVVQRRVKNGSIEETKDITKAFDKINQIQSEHIVASPADLIAIGKSNKGEVRMRDLGVDYLAESIIKGGALIGGLLQRGELPDDADDNFGIVLWSIFGLNEARFCSKMWALHRGRNAAMTLLKHLVNAEMQEYHLIMGQKLYEINHMPHIYDINLALVGQHGVAIGKAVESGIWATTEDSEHWKVSPEVKREYGDVNEVTSSPLERHSLSSEKGNLIKIGEKEFDFINNNGAFYVEKYVRLFDREEPADSTNPTPDFIKNRSNRLKGVVNIKEFKHFLKSKKDDIPESIKISDWFMVKEVIEPDEEAKIKEDIKKKEEGKKKKEKEPVEYEDVVGIKYGVRLCYIPDKSYNPSGLVGSPQSGEIAQREKSFICKPLSYSVEGKNALNQSYFDTKTLQGSKYTFPVVEFEQEITDTELIKLLDTDDDLNQELRCYIDNMVRGTKFDLLFDKTLNVKRSVSLLMTMSFDSWVPSIGAIGSGERAEIEVPDAYEDQDEDPPTYSDPANSKYFNDCRAECRKLFISNYKRNDYDPKDEEEDFDPIADNVQQLISNTYGAVLYGSDVPFWMKWRVVKENPDDKGGQPCGNQFTSLFNKTGEQ